jgi:hypothetical protein
MLQLEPSHKSCPLSTVRQLPRSQSVRSGERAEPRACFPRRSAARLHHRANVLMLPGHAKLPDYIEAILHCKGVSRPLIQRASIVLRSDPMHSKGGIDRDGHPPLPKNVDDTHLVREHRSCLLSRQRPRRLRCDEFVCFLTSLTPSHSIFPCRA